MTVTDSKPPAPYRRSARLLAALVMASIAWGAIAEATHRHGNQSTIRSRLTLTADASPQSSTARLETTETENSQTGSSNAGQCLICQLQQNLSTILFAPPLRFAIGDPLSVRLSSLSAPLLSRSALPQQGRAPPSNL